MDFLLIILILALSITYLIWKTIKKRHAIKHLGACGHDCEHCPFAKYNQGTPACCATQPKPKTTKR